MIPGSSKENYHDNSNLVHEDVLSVSLMLPTRSSEQDDSETHASRLPTENNHDQNSKRFNTVSARNAEIKIPRKH